ncbi:hypothetical protein SARC_01344 [Sphaeroforma arctica JP610]|uniref:Uncharacterized protein n=1 Tax=Sphaeroforma arctica JP610 TaxID=667725 RepID=A0A0L0GC73_9EUKA|nr:hypothetical protein SARC_01344 [Sphaeroforma arctica JP610]KNC86514.1 hypothetical protein SARC_01344 [Sphaeroforma arctica JP610]|eukprot:XP_014160416.1 hypothetical protein SARC_01344 [Sphaeroforma arctica JP610]
MRSCLTYLGLVGLAFGPASALDVTPADSLVDAVNAMQPGETLNLAPGAYPVNEPIIVDKAILVNGTDAQIFVPATDSIVFVFANAEGYSSVLDGLTIVTAGGSSCAFAEPYALQANFTIDILSTTVSNNKVNIFTDVGIWHNMRKLEDVIFADCRYSEDHPEKMSGVAYKLIGNCRSQVDFSVAFDKLGGAAGCGTNIQDFATFTSYRGQVEAQWQEYVTKVDDEKSLRLPVTREGNAVTNLLIQIDTVRNVAATIQAAYPLAEIEAAINLVDVGYWDGWNQSLIRIEVHLPAPYTVKGNHEGEVQYENLLVGNMSPYTVSDACNLLTTGDDCIQQIIFTVEACDLTGAYQFLQVPIECEAETSPGVPADCPIVTPEDGFADILFFIDTNNFCEVETIELDALFQLFILIHADDTYTTEHINGVFSLGEMTYWSILVDTRASGVTLYNAEVTEVVRTTDGDCSSYPDYLGVVADLEPGVFTQTYMPDSQEIRMPIVADTVFACATSDRNGNSITMNFTVLVDYDDGGGARRRRGLDIFTRDAGEMAVEEEAGVQYTEEDLKQATIIGAGTAAGAVAADYEASKATRMLVLGASVALLLAICVCGCCCALGLAMIIRQRGDKSLEREMKLQEDSFTLGASAVSSTPSSANDSTISFCNSSAVSNKAPPPSYSQQLQMGLLGQPQVMGVSLPVIRQPNMPVLGQPMMPVLGQPVLSDVSAGSQTGFSKSGV